MEWETSKSSRTDGIPPMLIKRLFKSAWLGIDLHKMICSDVKDCFHTHPYYAVRIVLYGGYLEETENGEVHWWLPGRCGIVKPQTSHRIAALYDKVSYSLWIRFKKIATIELKGKGWLSDDRGGPC